MYGRKKLGEADKNSAEPSSLHSGADWQNLPDEKCFPPAEDA
jgi:hypothetical protein